jgi:ABC-2 type transport system permease protein
VLQRLDLTAAAEQKLLPPLTWAGWAVPVGVQLLTVGVITVALIGLGARLFASTE